MKDMMRYAVMALMSVAMVAGAVHATASESDSENYEVVKVSYADLNLASDAGMATLQRRIDRAAEQVCGPQSTRAAGSLSRAKKGQDCFDMARESAMDSVMKRVDHL